MRPILAALLFLALPGAAAAHPHIFIDAGLGFLFDRQGRLAAVHVEWAYDEYYSLMLFEDLELDPDGDLALTDDELARLKAADSAWDDDYEGDLYGTADGAPIALGPPAMFEIRIEAGRVISSHVRPLVTPVDAAAHQVAFRTYDPSYYAAFFLTRHLLVQGSPGCTAQKVEADRAAALDRLEGLIAALPADGEGAFPQVGAEFADEARIACGG